MKTDLNPLTPSSPYSIAVTEDGSVFALAEGGAIFQGERSNPLIRMPGGLTSISAASDGTILGVNVLGDKGKCYSFMEGNWTPAYPGLPTTEHMAQVSVVSASVVWALDSQGNAYQYYLNTWSCVPLPNLPSNTFLTIIQATPDAVWALDSSGKIWSFDSSDTSWSSVATPNGVKMISISLSAQSWAWGIDSGNNVWQYSGSEWILRPTFGYKNGSQRASPRFICSSNDTTTLGLDSFNIPFRYDLGQNEWIQMPSTMPLSVLAVADGLNIWALNTLDNVYTYNVNAMGWTLIVADAYTQVSAQSASVMWSLLADNSVEAWDLDSDTYATINPGQPLIQISGGVDGTLWGIGTDQNPYQYNGPGVVPAFVEKAVSNAESKIIQMAVGRQEVVYALDNVGNFYQYSSSSWQGPLSLTGVATGNQLTYIAAASDGSLFAVDNQDNIYQYLSGEDFTAWYQFAGQFTQVAAGSNSNVWCLDAEGNLVQLTSGIGGEAPGADSWTRSEARIGPDWDAESPTDETLSTHLWIVNRASALAFTESTVGKLLQSIFSQDVFLSNLEQGLYDADFKDEFNNPTFFGVPTYLSHFYDPDTGHNYAGLLYPTALTQGRKYSNESVNYYDSGGISSAGYFLGVSLHYLTDLTQPMHAANFTALSSFPYMFNYGYHPVFEGHVMEHQGSVTPPSVYTPRNLGLWPDNYLIQAAKKSKTYYGTICPPEVFNKWGGQFTDSLRTTIDAQLGSILTDAINITSQYIVAWGNQIAKLKP
jgi:hypothetical protein